MKFILVQKNNFCQHQSRSAFIVDKMLFRASLATRPEVILLSYEQNTHSQKPFAGRGDLEETYNNKTTKQIYLITISVRKKYSTGPLNI